MRAHRWSVISHVVMGILLPCLFATSCAMTDGTINTQAEARFHELFGPTLTDSLVIVTDKRRYHDHDAIIYWVENKTKETILFRDQSYEVQALAYDTAAGQWVEVDLGFWIADPTPRVLEPGGGAVLQHDALWIEDMDLAGHGKIRLVITGHTDLERPALDRIYTAYTDIEVVQ